MTGEQIIGRFPKQIQEFIRLWRYYFPCDRVLAQRIFKSTVNSTVAFIFTLIPKVRAHLGTEPAMLPLISVIVHPGRRVSGTIQGAIYCTTGLIFGLAYSIFGRFLAQKCVGDSWNKLTEVEQYHQNFKRFEAALAIMAIFETIMLFFHGWMRSVSHHYFGIVFPLFLVTHFALMASLTESPGVIANSFATPFYLGIAMSIFWNLILFPEFGSTYLGTAAIKSMNELHKDIDAAINFFVSVSHSACEDDKSNDNSELSENNDLYAKPITTLSRLLKFKATMSKNLSTCEAVLQECIYEISYSYVSPNSLEKPISLFKDLSIFTNGIINACQLQFIVLGRSESLVDVSMDVTPDKEVAYADSAKFLQILDTLKVPIHDLHQTLSETMYKINVALAYAYDVEVKDTYYPTIFNNLGIKKMENKQDIPVDFDFESNIALLEDASTRFSEIFREQLLKFNKNAIDPSDEMFILSSFLMNFKECISAVSSIAKQIQQIYEYRISQEKKGFIRGKKIWFNFLTSFASFKEWMIGNSLSFTEGEALNGVIYGNNFEQQPELVTRRPNIQEEDLLQQHKKDYQHVDEINNSKLTLPVANQSCECSSSTKAPCKQFSATACVRSCMTWCNMFYKKYKAHFRFGTQVAVALQLASFPMFVPRLRHWYINYRGTWIGFVCILCLEPSVGGTFWVFFLRTVGVAFGALWGLVSYYSGQNQSNPYLETVITLFGAVPGFYFLLGTPYVKAAIIHIISIYVVILAAVLPTTIPSAIPVSFAKRCLAVGYGGTIALIVQVIIFPIKARDQLNEEISFVCGCISEMVSLYASGLEGERTEEALTELTYKKIVFVSKSAKEALDRAQAYNGLTRQEPRLKGEFTELEKIFSQVIFIQRQIIERLDTASLLRKTYGSAIIEELNNVMYPYRRQMIGSITSLMREMQEAFINKTPLPQYSPSARIAHRRLVNKVRSTLELRYPSKSNSRAISRFNSRHAGSIGMTPAVLSERNESDDSDNEEEFMIKTSNRVPFGNIKYNNVDEPLSQMNEISHGENLQQEFLLREKFLSWNASSAALEEIIEYIEVLLNLTKILVGVNEFKYGFLSRPLYEDWTAEAITGFDKFVNGIKEPEFNVNMRNVASSHSSASIAPDEVIDTESHNREMASSLSSNSDARSSIDSIEGPVAFNGEGTRQNRRPSVNLAKIASHKINQGETVPNNFRGRLNSWASGTFFQDELSAINRQQTLGDANPAFDVDKEDEHSDEDLPLALKMVVSHMKKRA
ncbi:similar to Saccharomyces cerevisiae YGL140C Putative protein of unknown function [Maudiozyma barnettii]|uniref:ER transporter 6TM N-terminal domain-containing protein n=1 Tax=Maudiozyma barnettii TaxID=61262 RepID=A0A8H2ZGH3_9SACH|nr:hypothetical protein [Kazachstania barnettii]CAB4253324.1 similar to Saccharomyces cerevisiae YGL140C Putative protein of unknown function [Kazachstania barnettii]CAD1780840.1 similar to Saccharomyces cerevisiae YGL140C Putative protein of unknown function [Kazachstania barnettii]